MNGRFPAVSARAALILLSLSSFAPLAGRRHRRSSYHTIQNVTRPAGPAGYR